MMLPEKLSYTSATSASTLSAESRFRSSSGYYTYTSPPRAVHGKFKRYRNNITKPRGAHDYYNMMYDPHIFRGRATTGTVIPSKNNTSKLLGGENNGNENKASAMSDNGTSSGEPNKLRRKRATTQQYPLLMNTTTSGIGYNNNNGGKNNNRYKITTRVTTRTGKGLLKLVDRQHTHVQTEQFLQDLSGDASPDERDAIVQTDAIHDLPCHPKTKQGSSSSSSIRCKSGVDATTQILPGELSTFDEDVQPLVETLVGKILQLALLETMEEEEIGALQEQQNKFLEKRKQEEKLLNQLKEQQQQISEEKERLKLQINGENSSYILLPQNKNNINSVSPTSAQDFSIQDRVILDQAIRSASRNQPNVPTSYLIELLPSVLNSLRQEGYLSDGGGDRGGVVGDGDMFSNFLPMWQSSSKAESEIGEPFTTGENSGSASADVDNEDAIKPNSSITSQIQDITTIVMVNHGQSPISNNSVEENGDNREDYNDNDDDKRENYDAQVEGVDLVDQTNDTPNSIPSSSSGDHEIRLSETEEADDDNDNESLKNQDVTPTTTSANNPTTISNRPSFERTDGSITAIEG